MALNFDAVKEAYKVFNELKHVVALDIPSWPEDMAKWSDEEKRYPRLNRVHGFDKKSDDGWENLFFIVKDPSQDLKNRFDELKGQVWNSVACHVLTGTMKIFGCLVGFKLTARKILRIAKCDGKTLIR